MKKTISIFTNLGNVITPINNIVYSNVYSVEHKANNKEYTIYNAYEEQNLDPNEEKLKIEKFLSSIKKIPKEKLDSFFEVNKILGENKKFEKKFESITSEKRKKIIVDIAEHLLKENNIKISREDILKKITPKIEKEFFKKLNSTIRKNKVTKTLLNKEFKKLKKKEQFVVNKDKNWKINITTEESSKMLLMEIIKIKEELNYLKEKALKIEKIKESFRIAEAVIETSLSLTSIASAGFFILSIIGFGIPAILGTAATITSISLGAALILVKTIKKIVFSFHEIKYDNYLNEISELGFDVLLNLINLRKIKILAGAKLKNVNFEKLNESITKFEGINSTLEGINAIYKIEETVKETVEQVKKCQDIVEKINSLEEKIKRLKNQSFDWVVVNESEQYGDYWETAIGGKNLHFMNLKTGEVKPLQYFLEKTNEELYVWNLVKVEDVNKGWYIRTLPNDNKLDNLG